VTVAVRPETDLELACPFTEIVRARFRTEAWPRDGQRRANLLLLVDQFEELFRHTVRPDSEMDDGDVKAQFVKLLITSLHDPDLPRAGRPSQDPDRPVTAGRRSSSGTDGLAPESACRPLINISPPGTRGDCPSLGRGRHARGRSGAGQLHAHGDLVRVLAGGPAHHHSQRRHLVSHLWRDDDLLREACARVTRNLTPAEWAKYLPEETYQKTCRSL
jgi:hypothetical protein